MSFDDFDYNDPVFKKDSDGFIYGYYFSQKILPGWNIKYYQEFSVNRFPGDYYNFVSLINKDYPFVNLRDNNTGDPDDDYFLLLSYIRPIDDDNPELIRPIVISQTGFIPENALLLTGSNPLYQPDLIPGKSRFTNEGMEVLMNVTPVKVIHEGAKFIIDVSPWAGEIVEIKFSKHPTDFSEERAFWILDNLTFVLEQNYKPGETRIINKGNELEIELFTSNLNSYEVLSSPDLSFWNTFKDNIVGNGEWIRVSIKNDSCSRFFRVVESQ